MWKVVVVGRRWVNRYIGPSPLASTAAQNKRLSPCGYRTRRVTSRDREITLYEGQLYALIEPRSCRWPPTPVSRLDPHNRESVIKLATTTAVS